MLFNTSTRISISTRDALFGHPRRSFRHRSCSSSRHGPEHLAHAPAPGPSRELVRRLHHECSFQERALAHRSSPSATSSTGAASAHRAHPPHPPHPAQAHHGGTAHQVQFREGVKNDSHQLLLQQAASSCTTYKDGLSGPSPAVLQRLQWSSSLTPLEQLNYCVQLLLQVSSGHLSLSFPLLSSLTLFCQLFSRGHTHPPVVIFRSSSG